ncbi:hypothetical protein DACRYDRAFT_93662 [Dacryopinax primogenitus]|uniref:Uncharacterized protein n=1 Tax=Dacryopinax primogenitus (strain DJM 731) TaxID=1858805 RepID=M5G280_DACPD|nr:uncharacterized protein DACRYDRAFT_93662 [Dacryopinax primogenitus]EJU04306.1 hypothetical protein DACRYDRAFT_93662 [Dacryopinax primogenitus]
MSPTIPGLPSGFPSSVSFKSSASNASMHTASPTQGLPMQFASRRELTSPTGFPQSPCESEADFDSDCERETGATDACSFSPVLGHPTTQHSPSATEASADSGGEAEGPWNRQRAITHDHCHRMG